jgi:hypothetical protein
MKKLAKYKYIIIFIGVTAMLLCLYSGLSTKENDNKISALIGSLFTILGFLLTLIQLLLVKESTDEAQKKISEAVDKALQDNYEKSLLANFSEAIANIEKIQTSFIDKKYEVTRIHLINLSNFLAGISIPCKSIIKKAGLESELKKINYNNKLDLQNLITSPDKMISETFINNIQLNNTLIVKLNSNIKYKHYENR